MKTPRVTVLMSVHNGAIYLRQAIESILKQSYEDFEFIIIDDASTDTTPEIIGSYRDRRIRVVRNDGKMGLTKSLNRGLDLADGEYIARMDADDISLPERLQRQILFLDSHPAVGVLGTTFKTLENGRLKNPYNVWPVMSDVIKWSLFFTSPLAHPSVVMRKDLIRQVGKYDSCRIHAQDYDLWCRLADITEFANLEETLIYIRTHDEQATRRYSETQVMSAVNSCRVFMGRILGEDVPAEFIFNLWEKRFNSATEINQAAAVIRKLYSQCLQIRKSSEEAKRLIRNDAAMRLFALARIRIFDVRCWSTLVEALQLDPLVAVRAAARFCTSRLF